MVTDTPVLWHGGKVKRKDGLVMPNVLKLILELGHILSTPIPVVTT